MAHAAVSPIQTLTKTKIDVSQAALLSLMVATTAVTLGIFSGLAAVTLANLTLPTTGLVSYWSFDNVESNMLARDQAGTNDLVILNPPTPSTVTTDIIKGAGLVFNGNDYGYITDNSGQNSDPKGKTDCNINNSCKVFSLDITRDITISAWVKRNSGTGYAGIVTKWGWTKNGTAINNHSYELVIDSNNKFAMAISRTGTDTSTSTVKAYSYYPVTNGQWYHVVGQVAYTGKLGTSDVFSVKLYINGALQTGAPLLIVPAGTDPIYAGSANVIFGAFNEGELYRLNGLVDEVRIYKGALSAADIKTLHIIDAANRPDLLVGKLNASVSAQPAPQNIAKGATGIIFTNLIFDATQSEKDVYVTKLPIKVKTADQAFPGLVNNIKFYSSGVEIVPVSSQIVYSGTQGTPGGFATTTFTFSSSSFRIPQGVSQTIEVRADVLHSGTIFSGYNDTIALGLPESGLVTADSKGNSIIPIVTAAAGSTMTIIPEPDLIISSMSIVRYVASPLIRVEIKNVGEASTTAPFVVMLADGAAQYQTVNNIPGDSVIVDFPMTFGLHNLQAYVDYNSEIDESNENNNSYSMSINIPTPVCGDKILASVGEECDDGNTVSGDGCSATCTIEQLPGGCTSAETGNLRCRYYGVNNGGPATGIEECKYGQSWTGTITCPTNLCCITVAVCGNGTVETGEQCDDGNKVSGDGCSSTCQKTCTDSDVTAQEPLGFNFYQQGITTGWENNQIVTRTDTCQANNQTLNEYYCDYSNHIDEKLYLDTCTWGCSNGACNTTSTPTSTASLIVSPVQEYPARENVIAGTQNHSFVKLDFDNSTSTVPIDVTKLALSIHTAGTAYPDLISNIHLYDGLTEILPNNFPGAWVYGSTGTTPGSFATTTFTFSTGAFRIPASSIRTITVKVDIGVGPIFAGNDDTIEIGLNYNNSVEAKDTSGSSIYAGVGGYLDAYGYRTYGPIHVLQMPSVGSVLITPKTTPVSALVVAGTTVPVGKFIMKAKDASLRLDNISFAITNPDSGIVGNGNDVVELSLYQDGVSTAIADHIPLGADNIHATATPATTLTLPQDTDVNFTLYAKFATLSPSSAAKSGDGIRLSVSNFTATNLGSGGTVVPTGVPATFMGSFTMFKSLPTFTTLSNPAKITGYSPTDIYKFRISADSAGPVSLYKLTFSVNIFTIAIDSSSFELSDSSGLIVARSHDILVDNESGTWVAKTFFDVDDNQTGIAKEQLIIDAGSSKDFTLRVTPSSGHDGTAGNESIASAIAGDANFYGLPDKAELVGWSSDFVWSDLNVDQYNSSTATNTKMFFSGYRVPGLSDNTSTAQTITD